MGVEPVAGGAGLREAEGEGEGEYPLGALPEAMQEQLLLDDLLSALMGFAGRCVCVGGWSTDVFHEEWNVPVFFFFFPYLCGDGWRRCT